VTKKKRGRKRTVVGSRGKDKRRQYQGGQLWHTGLGHTTHDGGFIKTRLRKGKIKRKEFENGGRRGGGNEEKARKGQKTLNKKLTFGRYKKRKGKGPPEGRR